MNKILYKAGTRKHFDHGWLKTWHSFSFGNYYDPRRMNFGVLRVLNDDIIDPNSGFGTHPHDNMEIITIPLSGTLTHKDSTGNEVGLKYPEIQVMSAGTGIQHSEYNLSETEPVSLLQIWIIPEERGLTPSYDQRSCDVNKRINKFDTAVSPENNGENLTINQNSYISLGKFDKDRKAEYQIKSDGNGAFVFLINGSIKINSTELNSRDALGISECSEFPIDIIEDSEILVIEVPMN
ncbi:pirin family protein [candidate division KSB1 bacterium]